MVFLSNSSKSGVFPPFVLCRLHHPSSLTKHFIIYYFYFILLKQKWGGYWHHLVRCEYCHLSGSTAIHTENLTESFADPVSFLVFSFIQNHPITLSAVRLSHIIFFLKFSCCTLICCTMLTSALLHSSIICCLFRCGFTVGASSLSREALRHFWPHLPLPALLEETSSVFTSQPRHMVQHVSWVFCQGPLLIASPQGGVLVASLPDDARTTSTGSSRCGGAVAVL